MLEGVARISVAPRGARASMYAAFLDAAPRGPRAAAAFFDALAEDAERVGGATAADLADALASHAARQSAPASLRCLAARECLRLDDVDAAAKVRALEALAALSDADAASSWRPAFARAVLRADVLSDLVGLCATPHPSAPDVGAAAARVFLAARASWAEAFDDDRRRTFLWLKERRLPVTEMARAPSVMAKHSPLVDLYNAHLRHLDASADLNAPSALRAWRRGLLKFGKQADLVGLQGSLVDLATFGFMASTGIVVDATPDAAGFDASLLHIFTVINVVLETSAKLGPRAWTATLKTGEDLWIADFVAAVRARTRDLPRAFLVLKAWARPEDAP